MITMCQLWILTGSRKEYHVRAILAPTFETQLLPPVSNFQLCLNLHSWRTEIKLKTKVFYTCGCAKVEITQYRTRKEAKRG